MIKITEESIKEHLISKGWEETAPTIISCDLSRYISKNKRYTLEETPYTNLCEEYELGWLLHIDDSRMCSLASCDVEYIEQIFALIDIYKDY